MEKKLFCRQVRISFGVNTLVEKYGSSEKQFSSLLGLFALGLTSFGETWGGAFYLQGRYMTLKLYNFAITAHHCVSEKSCALELRYLAEGH